jgi:hypothetical protein
MAPSSYAADYIEYLNRQGKFVSQGSEALKIEPVEPVPSRTAVRQEERRLKEPGKREKRRKRRR